MAVFEERLPLKIQIRILIGTFGGHTQTTRLQRVQCNADTMCWPVHGQRVDEQEVYVHRIAVCSVCLAHRVFCAKSKRCGAFGFIASVSERPQVYDCGVGSDLGEYG